MYDNQKTVTVNGTVSEYRWQNPHVLLFVKGVDAAGGGEQLWTMELNSPSQVARKGWTHSTLKVGDKVTVTLHPFHDGRLGGSLIDVTLPNGEKIAR